MLPACEIANDGYEGFQCDLPATPVLAEHRAPERMRRPLPRICYRRAMKHLLLLGTALSIGLSIVLAGPGCGSSKSPAKEESSMPSARAPERLVAGDYACGFSNTAEFLCRITEDGEFVSLEKLGGSAATRVRLGRRLSRDLPLRAGEVVLAGAGQIPATTAELMVAPWVVAACYG